MKEKERATSEMAAQEGSAPGKSVKGRGMNQRVVSAGRQTHHYVRRAVQTGNQKMRVLWKMPITNEMGAR